MKHDLQALLVPSVAYKKAIQVGNIESVGGVIAHDYSLAEEITIYKNEGIGIPFMCCEIKPETSAREEFSRNVYGIQDKCYINADRDLDYKEDDIVFLPFGKYRIVATDNHRERPTKNGFFTQQITINIEMVKQDD